MRLAFRTRRLAFRKVVRHSTQLTASSPAELRPLTSFSDARLAFAHTSTPKLMRGAAVLTACSQPWLAKHSEAAIALANKLLGPSVTTMLLKHTVFEHFVAGEDAAAIAPVLTLLHERGVGGILDYAAEADLDSGSASVSPGINQPSRVYPYESEAMCEANKAIFLSAVRAVHDTAPTGFAAVKVTALGDPALLERVSTSLTALRAFFNRLDTDGGGTLDRATFVRGWCEAFDVSEAESLATFSMLDHDGGGCVDVLEFTNRLDLDAISPLVSKCRVQGPLYRSALDGEECAALGAMLRRLDEIAQLASSLGVRLMVDAEHTYLQPAIDHAVLRLQRAHNKVYPAIYGTRQAYLVDCAAQLSLDIERARREGWHLGVKLVRGAYMVHERQRAAALGYDDPIHPSAEATHASFDEAIKQLLVHCPCPERTSLMVATHNQPSVELVTCLLSSGASSIPRECVHFGQLLGMADHLTFTLAANGYQAYKYVPYGPVHEVLPYLIRRAYENADALSGARAQRNMMLSEVRRRFVGA